MSQVRASPSSSMANWSPHMRMGLRKGSVQSRSEEHTSELQSPCNLVCRLLLEKKKKLFSYVLAVNRLYSICTNATESISPYKNPRRLIMLYIWYSISQQRPIAVCTNNRLNYT